VVGGPETTPSGQIAGTPSGEVPRGLGAGEVAPTHEVGSRTRDLTGRPVCSRCRLPTVQLQKMPGSTSSERSANACSCSWEYLFQFSVFQISTLFIAPMTTQSRSSPA
jgi:hypothetical protein